ncbi:flavin reductase family protein [Candidatus Woesearchaeota archaeon]|nr:flavin reductase family protein [Candidatus Woesearchaeota archaeon]
MNLPWGDEKTVQFITNVGLITSDGPYGFNIMAAEWTNHVSYNPGLIAVHLGFNKATTENIKKTKKFGVSLASTNQSVLVSVAGGNSAKDTDKISALKDLGFKFYKGKNGILMVEDAALNVECRLIKTMKLGDHIMFVGEISDVSISGKEPLAYHKGRYWRLTETLKKPSDKDGEEIKNIILKYKKT